MIHLRLASRQLLQSPLFAIVAVTALGLGIGAATTAFSAFNTIRLKPLPLLAEQDRLVRVEEFLFQEPATELGCSYPDALDINAVSRTLLGVAVMRPKTFILTDREAPERLLGGEISARTFSILGVVPSIGRDFLPEDEGPGRPPVVLLGHGLWARRYGEKTNIVGQTISISGHPATVVGVMPPGWKFPENADIWSPISFNPAKEGRGEFFLSSVGRLKPGVSWVEANAEMSSIAAQIEERFPDTNAGIGIRVQPLREAITRDIGTHLMLLLGAVLFVQLIACANVANLLLARGGSRTREFAIRLALGAPRGQVIHQLLIEGLLLGLLGGAVGFVLALWGRDLCREGIGRELPFWVNFDFDFRVFGFALALSLVSVLAFALLPALQTARPELVDELREGSRGAGVGARHARLRHALVVGEIAIALVLLVGAGLMIRSFIKTQGADYGYDARSLLTFRVGLPPQYYTNTAEYVTFFRDVRARLLKLPGVRQAAAVSLLPAVDGQMTYAFHVDGRPAPALHEAPRLEGRLATPGYFGAMKIPLLAGRDFSAADTTNTPQVCIVDEALVRRDFPDGQALGRALRMLGGKEGRESEAKTIVGVVGRIQSHFDNRPILPVAYAPHAQWPEAFMSFVARVDGDPLAYERLVQQEVFAVNPEIPIYTVRSMEEVINRHTWDKRFFGALFAAFAGLALFLAALGVYGVMAYTVGQRTAEIGLRMALGAQGPDVLRLVLEQGVRLAFTGLALGSVAAFLLARLLESVLFGVSPYDPPIFAVVPILLGLVALLASFVPAWRAARIPPMAALRRE